VTDIVTQSHPWMPATCRGAALAAIEASSGTDDADNIIDADADEASELSRACEYRKVRCADVAGTLNPRHGGVRGWACVAEADGACSE